MTIIEITKSKKSIMESIAKYYLTTQDKINVDSMGNVYVAGKKTKTQVAEYKNLFVFAFVK